MLLFPCSVVSNSLRPLELQHARLPCPSPSPGVCSDSCSLNQWCHPTLLSSVSPFSWLQSFPASFFSNKLALRIRWPKYWASASASVLPINLQGWFPLGFACLISMLSKALSRVFSSPTIWKFQFVCAQLSLWSNCHIHTRLLEKPKLWLYGPWLAKWCLCFLICCLSLSSFSSKK